MSFYDDASLVVIPSGYKTSKVYAEKPTDGSGDLAFTRTGDTATRVNSAGLVEKVRTNLVLQSEAFNTTWVPSRGAVTANATTAPNGTTTADKFVPDTQVNPHFVSQAISGLTSGGIYTCSVYAKLAEWNSLAIFRGDSAIGVNFRLDTQAMTVLAGSPVTYSITDAGNGWYRCSMSFAIASTSDGAQFRVGNNSNYSIAGNNANGLFLWGAQYENTDFGATTYIPTTTAAVSVGPVANRPRLDYLGSTCPRLLLEPQRTNLVAYSNQLNLWNRFTNTTKSLDSNVIDPEGYSSNKYLRNSSSVAICSKDTISISASTTYTFTYFAKKGNYSTQIVELGSGANNIQVSYNFDTGALTNVPSGTQSVISSSAQSFGNGWVRITVVFTGLITSTNCTIFIGGVLNDFVYIYGAQLEAGAYATSYIPTLAASATRGADAASKTGISSLIGQTEGTLFMDVNKTLRTDSPVRLNISDGTANNWIFIGLQTNNSPILYVITAGSTVANITSIALSSGRHKIAGAYKNNDFVLYVDGVQIGTDTSGGVGATSRFQYGGNYIDTGAETDSLTNQVLLFKTRLTNAELATLTTL
jgi:hypothetical protein